MDSESAAPIFKTCGISIFLNGVNQPESITVFDPVPESLKDFEKFRREGKKSDVVVIIGDKRLNLHKLLLNARVPFFRSLFNSNMIECTSGEINLSSTLCEFDLNTLESLLDYAYTGYLTISEDYVQNILMGAVYLQLKSVMDVCARFLRRRININNALPILFFCRSINFNAIDDFVLRFIDKNFVPISLTRDFFELSIDDLISILQRDSLYVDSEIRVFEAITRWVRNRTDRKEHANRLINCIRCSALSENFISENIEQTSWVAENPEFTAIIEMAKNKDKKADSPIPLVPRVCADAHQLIFAIGSTLMQIYDPITNEWTKSKASKNTLFLNTATVVDHKIYMVNHLASYTENIKYLDTTTNEWSAVPNSSCKRMQVATGVINGKIYVAGGILPTAPTVLSSLEVFDPEIKEWNSLAEMSVKRSSPVATVLNGKLYVIGGRNNSGDVNVVECYDPDSDRWATISSLKHKRCALAATAFNGRIYVAGGYDGSTLLNEVESYDPTTNSWTTHTSMNYRRADATLVASCGKLFALGGFDQVSICPRGHMLNNPITSVEMYHPETDSWEVRKSMHECSFQIGTLPVPPSLPSPVDNLEGNFCHFLLKPELGKAIDDCKFIHPTEVQHNTITRAIRGESLVCQANSNSGKTTTYIISTLHQLEPIEGEVSVLVICPTRDLASQLGKKYERFSKYLPNPKVQVFCDHVGNKKKQKDKRSTKKIIPHIVVGTPALIQSQIKAGALNLDHVKHLVIDNCDRIIGDFKHRSLVNTIVKKTPQKKQVLMFSSVLHKSILQTSEKFIRNGFFE